MTKWFRWERNNGRWSPVVYHIEKPRVPSGDEERFTSAVSVPADCMDASGDPMFGMLQERFPAPVPREDA